MVTMTNEKGTSAVDWIKSREHVDTKEILTDESARLFMAVSLIRLNDTKVRTSGLSSHYYLNSPI